MATLMEILMVLSTDVKLDWKKDPLTEKLKDFSMVGKKE